MADLTVLDHYADAELTGPTELTDRERLRFLADCYAGYGDSGYDDLDRLPPDTSWLQPDPLD